MRYIPLLLLALASGCQTESAVPRDIVDAASARFQLSDKTGAIGVKELRERLAAGERSEAVVTIVGTLGGMPNPWGDDPSYAEFPFMQTSARLFLVDDTVVAKFASHTHSVPDEVCAFCASHAEENRDGVAMVEFVGSDGDALPYRADELLKSWQLKPGQRLVVTGKAQLLGDLLVVEAEGIAVE